MRLEKQSMRQEQIQIQFLKEIQISIFDMCTTTNTDANKLWREIQISTYFRPKWIYNNRLTILQSATQSIRKIRNSSHSTAMQVMNSFVTTVPCPLRKTPLSLHDSTRAL